MSGADERPVRPCAGAADVRLAAPPSKSVAARALVLAALAPGVSRLGNLPLATDTTVFLAGLRALGVELEREAGGRAVSIEGRPPPLPPGPRLVDAGDAGTAMRFLTALAALGPGPVRLDGTPRMRQRPIGPLTGALAALGVSAGDMSGHPPVEVSGGPPRGGPATVCGEVSSQFASSLVLVAPALERGLDLTVSGHRVSTPYLSLSAAVVERFGGRVIREAPGRIRVEPGGLRPRPFRVDGDWSSACFPLAAAAVTGGRAVVTGLDPGSPQADRAFPALLEQAGVEVLWGRDSVEARGRPRRGLEADLRGTPDAAPALAAVAAVAPGPSSLRGLAHLRHKESDRLEALATGLDRLGAGVEILPDGLRICPGPLRGALVDPRGDHRIAMALALLGLAVPGVRIAGAGCVAKSWPGFWEALALFEGGGRGGGGTPSGLRDG